MLFYYDNNGKLVTISPHGEIPRQAGNLILYVLMNKNFNDNASDPGEDGLGMQNRMMTARFKNQSDVNFSEDYPMTRSVNLYEFNKLPGENIGSLIDGEEYYLFTVDLSNTNANKKSGKLDIVFTLWKYDTTIDSETNEEIIVNDMSKTITFGKATIYVEDTLGLEPYSGIGMTYTEYQSLMAYLNQLQSDVLGYKAELDSSLPLKEDKANKVTSISSESTDIQYPSAKAVYDIVTTESSALQLQIDGIKDGTNLDSFSDVEVALTGKLNVPTITLSGTSGTLTAEQTALVASNQEMFIIYGNHYYTKNYKSSTNVEFMYSYNIQDTPNEEIRYDYDIISININSGSADYGQWTKTTNTYYLNQANIIDLVGTSATGTLSYAEYNSLTKYTIIRWRESNGSLNRHYYYLRCVEANGGTFVYKGQMENPGLGLTPGNTSGIFIIKVEINSLRNYIITTTGGIINIIQTSSRTGAFTPAIYNTINEYTMFRWYYESDSDTCIMLRCVNPEEKIYEGRWGNEFEDGEIIVQIGIEDTPNTYGNYDYEIHVYGDKAVSKSQIGYIELSSASGTGTLTDEQYIETAKPYCILIYNTNRVFYKATNTYPDQQVFVEVKINSGTDTSNGKNYIVQYYIVIQSNKNYSITGSSLLNQYTNDKIDTLLSAKENLSNKVTSISGSSTDTEYPSARAVYSILSTETNDLQSQIDGINAGQNLVDIVANLTALNSLDTSKLQSGDKVEVLSDSNHDNISTVYNWSGSTWEYIGAYGTDSYTKAQTDSKLNEKQNTIDSSNKLSADLVDDTNATNKFVTASEKTQITTNQNDITAIKDGQSLDSFADVETALLGKVDKSQIGYIELSTTVGTLTDAQLAECLKDYAIIKCFDDLFYKQQITSSAQITFKKIGFIPGTTANNAYLMEQSIFVNINSKQFNLQSDIRINIYNKAQTDTLLSGKVDKCYVELSPGLNVQSGTITQEQYDLLFNSTEAIIGIKMSNDTKLYKKTRTLGTSAYFEYEVKGVYNGNTNVGISHDMITIYNNLSWSKTSSQIVRVYDTTQTDTLLSAKQDVLSGSTSIDITSNVASVKDTYVENFFATDQEVENMLEEVFE